MVRHASPPMAGDEAKSGETLKKILLVLNCMMLAIGTTCGPLIMRLYFTRGGKRIWLSGWLQTAGWPIITIPLAVSYVHRHRRSSAATTSSTGTSSSSVPRPVQMKAPLFVASAAVGVLTGFDDYLYAYGVAHLPVSTASLIVATQLAFTAGFAFIFVKQRLTPYSINSVFLLTLAAAVLALHTGSDKLEGESKREYAMGFVMTVAAAALYGFILPLVELSYMKAKQIITYSLVLEYQLVMCFFATAVCTVGMLINNDFQEIPIEAKMYGMGELKYYVVVVWNAVIWQFSFLGTIGVIFCSSSLTSGVIMTVLLPATELLAVIFFKEKFQVEKGISLTLSLWGFVSYFYGEMSLHQNHQPPPPADNGNARPLCQIECTSVMKII
ncbi:hypothetical protein SAY86_003544 [Trapa natans]|uniref:Probable purine permease n=1 Tax=Trapa natans TaxID=22666 RepID=A0AAN7MEC2_TRANT|nr:hypothetical protein SAY86_003544 [Trapa natans]